MSSLHPTNNTTPNIQNNIKQNSKWDANTAFKIGLIASSILFASTAGAIYFSVIEIPIALGISQFNCVLTCVAISGISFSAFAISCITSICRNRKPNPSSDPLKNLRHSLNEKRLSDSSNISEDALIERITSDFKEIFPESYHINLNSIKVLGTIRKFLNKGYPIALISYLLENGIQSKNIKDELPDLLGLDFFDHLVEKKEKEIEFEKFQLKVLEWNINWKKIFKIKDLEFYELSYSLIKGIEKALFYNAEQYLISFNKREKNKDTLPLSGIQINFKSENLIPYSDIEPFLSYLDTIPGVVSLDLSNCSFPSKFRDSYLNSPSKDYGKKPINPLYKALIHKGHILSKMIIWIENREYCLYEKNKNADDIYRQINSLASLINEDGSHSKSKTI